MTVCEMGVEGASSRAVPFEDGTNPGLIGAGDERGELKLG